MSFLAHCQQASCSKGDSAYLQRLLQQQPSFLPSLAFVLFLSLPCQLEYDICSHCLWIVESSGLRQGLPTTLTSCLPPPLDCRCNVQHVQPALWWRRCLRRHFLPLGGVREGGPGGSGGGPRGGQELPAVATECWRGRGRRDRAVAKTVVQEWTS